MKRNRKGQLQRLLSVGVLSGAVLSTGLTSPAQAGGVVPGMIVFDPTNYVQNLETAYNTVEALAKQATMISNQISSLTNQAESLVNQATGLANQAKNLMQLPLSIRAQYETDIANLQSLLTQTQTFATHFATLQSSFQSQYPNFGNTPGAETTTNYVSQLSSWASTTENEIGKALRDDSHNASIGQTATNQLDQIANMSTSGNLDTLQKADKIALVSAQALHQLNDLTEHATTAEDTYLQQQEVQQTVQNNADANLLRYTPMTVPAGGPGMPTAPTGGATYP